MAAELTEYEVDRRELKHETPADVVQFHEPAQVRYERFLAAVNSSAVHYQPIIDIHTGVSMGAEALIRPQTISECMSQQDFIQYAQEHDFVPRITEVVLKDVLQRARSAAPAFGKKSMPADGSAVSSQFSYTVNVSPACLADQTCIDLVNQFLHLTSHRFLLVLELSEANVFPCNLLDEFYEKTGKDDRIRYALDDFGVGQSRFENLSSPLVKWAKIDRSFLSFKEDEGAYRTLKAIVEFAQFFDCDIVVEGIETEMQLDMVSKLEGVHLAQGFLLARPAPWQ